MTLPTMLKFAQSNYSMIFLMSEFLKLIFLKLKLDIYSITQLTTPPGITLNSNQENQLKLLLPDLHHVTTINDSLPQQLFVLLLNQYSKETGRIQLFYLKKEIDALFTFLLEHSIEQCEALLATVPEQTKNQLPYFNLLIENAKSQVNEHQQIHSSLLEQLDSLQIHPKLITLFYDCYFYDSKKFKQVIVWSLHKMAVNELLESGLFHRFFALHFHELDTPNSVLKETFTQLKNHSTQPEIQQLIELLDETSAVEAGVKLSHMAHYSLLGNKKTQGLLKLHTKRSTRQWQNLNYNQYVLIYQTFGTRVLQELLSIARKKESSDVLIAIKHIVKNEMTKKEVISFISNACNFSIDKRTQILTPLARLLKDKFILNYYTESVSVAYLALLSENSALFNEMTLTELEKLINFLRAEEFIEDRIFLLQKLLFSFEKSSRQHIKIYHHLVIEILDEPYLMEEESLLQFLADNVTSTALFRVSRSLNTQLTQALKELIDSTITPLKLDRLLGQFNVYSMKMDFLQDILNVAQLGLTLGGCSYFDLCSNLLNDHKQLRQTKNTILSVLERFHEVTPINSSKSISDYDYQLINCLINTDRYLLTLRLQEITKKRFHDIKQEINGDFYQLKEASLIAKYDVVKLLIKHFLFTIDELYDLMTLAIERNDKTLFTAILASLKVDSPNQELVSNLYFSILTQGNLAQVSFLLKFKYYYSQIQLKSALYERITEYDADPLVVEQLILNLDPYTENKNYIEYVFLNKIPYEKLLLLIQFCQLPSSIRPSQATIDQFIHRSVSEKEAAVVKGLVEFISDHEFFAILEHANTLDSKLFKVLIKSKRFRILCKDHQSHSLLQKIQSQHPNKRPVKRKLMFFESKSPQSANCEENDSTDELQKRNGI